MRSSLQISTLLALLIVRLFSSLSASASLDFRSEEREALLEIADHFNFDDHIWKGARETNHCNWEGIRCTSLGLIESIQFDSFRDYPLTHQSIETSSRSCWGGIQAPLPINALQRLPQLHTLSFAVCSRLLGPLPEEIDQLSNLVALNLASNRLSGTLPSGLWRLPSLQVLNLRNNRLNGTLPSRMDPSLSRLKYLDLSGNQLDGELPSAFLHLPWLKTLKLSSNRLTGPLPTIASNTPYSLNLKHLDLSHNRLKGPIPPSLENLQRLKVLDLSYNQFSSSIPPQLSELQNLEELYLNNNLRLEGPIPIQLGKLKNLRILNLSHNQLSGGIPWRKRMYTTELSSLEYLSLEDNQLEGTIPQYLGNLLYLQAIHLEGNKLEGYLPANFGFLNQVTYDDKMRLSLGFYLCQIIRDNSVGLFVLLGLFLGSMILAIVDKRSFPALEEYH